HTRFSRDWSSDVCSSDLVNVLSDAGWGAPGLAYTWPQARSPAGPPAALDRISSEPTGRYRKFYLPPDQRVAWAGLEAGAPRRREIGRASGRGRGAGSGAG